jgi:hypothetical protein
VYFVFSGNFSGKFSTRNGLIVQMLTFTSASLLSSHCGSGIKKKAGFRLLFLSSPSSQSNTAQYALSEATVNFSAYTDTNFGDSDAQETVAQTAAAAAVVPLRLLSPSWTLSVPPTLMFFLQKLLSNGRLNPYLLPFE